MPDEDRVTDKELAEIRERAEAATLGPAWVPVGEEDKDHWYHLFLDVSYSRGLEGPKHPLVWGCDHCAMLFIYEPDARLIIHARQDVLSLLAEVEGLREILRELLDCADGFAEGEETAKVWDPFWVAYEEAHKLLGRKAE